MSRRPCCLAAAMVGLVLAAPAYADQASVVAGHVQRSTAHASAVAAYPCLKDLK
jgi:hypothetical protein